MPSSNSVEDPVTGSPSLSTPVIGPADAMVVPRYWNATTFARLPTLERVGSADVAVVGVPFDAGATYRPGARFGPQHVRQSSQLLRGYHPLHDIAPLESFQIADAGDLVVHPFDIEATISA